MGNFERLSVLVIVVIIVLIVVIALVQLTEGSTDPMSGPADGGGTPVAVNPPTEPAMASGVTLTPQPPSPGPAMDNGQPMSLDRILNMPPTPPVAPTPEPVKAPEAPKPEEPKAYVVQSGDTLAKIAKLHYPTSPTRGLALIEKANPDVDARRLRVGQRVTLPPLDGAAPTGVAPSASGTSTTSASATVRPSTATTASSIAPGGTYTTKKGDTLASISRRAFGRTDRWQDIWLANYEAIGDDVDAPPAGIRLKIPR